MPAPKRLTLAFHTLDYPPDDGVSSIGLYTHRMARVLAERGHRVHVFSRGSSGDSEDKDGPVTVHRLGPPRFSIPKKITAGAATRLVAASLRREWLYRKKLARRLHELVRKEGINLIEAADTSAEALFFRPQDHPQVPFVIRLHGPTAMWEMYDRNLPEAGRRAVQWFERRFFLKATHLTTPSHGAKRLFSQNLDLPEERISVFPNLLSFELSDGHQPGEIDPQLVVYVGRLTEIKGVTLLMKAIPGVLAARPQTRFILVGPDAPTGRNHSSTLAYLRTILPVDCRDAVEFTGYRPHAEIADYYRRAAIVVLPSLFDNFPYACLEAMSFGKAIVGSRSGGMEDMLDNGRCGLLFTPPDTLELERHILTLLGDSALRQRLGKAARERVLRHYHPDVVINETEAFYYRAIAECADS